MLNFIILSVTMLSFIILSVVMLSFIILNVVMLSVIMLSFVFLSVIMLSFIILSVIMLSFIILSVVMLSFIILSVVMLSVKEPTKQCSRTNVINQSHVDEATSLPIVWGTTLKLGHCSAFILATFPTPVLNVGCNLQP
jgi:hypothetical protein